MKIIHVCSVYPINISSGSRNVHKIPESDNFDTIAVGKATSDQAQLMRSQKRTVDKIAPKIEAFVVATTRVFKIRK